MRSSGVRDVIIYCRDVRCSHHVEVNADGWPDDVRLPVFDLDPAVEPAGAAVAVLRDQTFDAHQARMPKQVRPGTLVPRLGMQGSNGDLGMGQR